MAIIDLRSILDLAWPRSCFGCGTALTNRNGFLHICQNCLRRIDFILPPFCHRCGCPHFEENRHAVGCGACAGRDFAFLSCRSLFELRDVGRRLVHELKFRAGHHLLPDIGRMVAEFCPELAGKILVPVPLHWRRRWLRGFNQSMCISQALAKELHCRVCPLLRRVRHTRTQVGLSQQQRRSNVVGAFSINPSAIKKNCIAREEELILVDDVFTTGSTLHACAEALAAEGGFVRIRAFTLARA
ncbi:MAG: ComF family protein [Puniceicoccales bacterium]|jgi:ComF family protein|nr:ComF family protein [Puniceicoccales bacterium]